MTNPWHRIPTRLKRSLKITFFVVGVAAILDLSVVVGFSVLRPTIPHNVDAVIVLGAKVGTPALKYRTLTGLMHYQEDHASTLVLSGAQGPGEPTSEAQAMDTVIKDQIQKTHAKMPHIMLDTKSTNTYQNLRDSKALIPHVKSVVVVSDCYHLARSVLVAKSVGFQNVYWDAPTPSYYSAMDLVHYYIREVVALVAYIPKFV